MKNENQDWTRVSLRSVITYWSDSGVSYEKLAKIWGVSKLQVFNYATGKTKKPSVETAMAIYNTTPLEGKKVVIDNYKNERHLLDSYEMFKAGF